MGIEPQIQPRRASRTAFVALDLSDPLVAWLAYRAEVVSAGHVNPRSLSFWLTRALRDRVEGRRKAAFDDEVALDQRRARLHPSAVSRLRGFYVFEEQATARAAVAEWGFKGTHSLVEVAMLDGCKFSRHDAQWITLRLGDKGSQQWMAHYLAGEPCPATPPMWELVVEGRAIIFGTDARERAHDTVKRCWPRSLPLLELARVAVELDSDLGLIVPVLSGPVDHLSVRYEMSSADMADDQFLNRFAKFRGPKNTADLHGGSDLILPDLTGRGFSLPR